MSPAAAVLNKPALATCTAPPAPTLAFTASWLPAKAILPNSVTPPFRVVVPVPACCVKLAATTVLLAVTSLADTTFKAPRAATPPTAPPKAMSPVPAVRLKPRGVPGASLFTVLLKLILPAPAPVARTRSAPTTMAGPLTLITPPAEAVELVSTDPAILMAEPVKLTAPPVPVPLPCAVVERIVRAPLAFRVMWPAVASPALVTSPLEISVPVLMPPLLAVVAMSIVPPSL